MTIKLYYSPFFLFWPLLGSIIVVAFHNGVKFSQHYFAFEVWLSVGAGFFILNYITLLTFAKMQGEISNNKALIIHFIFQIIMIIASLVIPYL